MPLGKYKNFAECEKAKGKEYCGKLYWKVHGKKEGSKKLKHELEKLKERVRLL